MKQTIITALLALVTIAGQAQTSFDPEEGCLNVVDVSYSQGIGEYGDGGIAAKVRFATRKSKKSSSFKEILLDFA